MYGMGATGNQIDGIQHVRQSVSDIITTPVGSRVWRRDYGSRVPDLIDNPLNSSTLLSIYTETADALSKWEPRFTLQRIKWAQLAPDSGFVGLVLYGDIDLTQGAGNYKVAKQAITFDVAFVTSTTQSTNSTDTTSTTAKPVVQYQPAVSIDGGVSTVTLAQLPASGYPVQMSFDGVLHNAIDSSGATYRYAYDASGDQITAYYYVRGAA